MAVTFPTRPRSRRQPTRAAWGRSASIISAHLADKIISVVTVTASHRYAAVAVARALLSDALKRQALPSSRPADDRAQHRAEPAPGMAMHNIQARQQRAGRQPRAVEQPTTRRSLDNRAPLWEARNASVLVGDGGPEW